MKLQLILIMKIIKLLEIGTAILITMLLNKKPWPVPYKAIKKIIYTIIKNLIIKTS